MAVYCNDECKESATCDFCMWVKREERMGKNGQIIIGEPIGCNLHLEQEINKSCEDFWCYLSKDKLINAGKLAQRILHLVPINYKWFIHEITKEIQKEVDL